MARRPKSRALQQHDEEQSSAAEEISKSVEAISSVTQESASGTQQIAKAADNLNKLTVDLQNLISKFKINDRHSLQPSEREVHRSQLSVRANGVLVKE